MLSSFFMTAIMALVVIAAPAPQSSPAANAPFRYAPIALRFVGGPASYVLYLNADGQRYNTSVVTNPGLSVSQIESLPSDPYGNQAFNPSACIFETQNNAPVAVAPGSDTSVAVGPPQQIVAVRCRPTPAQGSCVSTLGACETGGDPFFGNVALPCCAGNICAATRCRSIS